MRGTSPEEAGKIGDVPTKPSSFRLSEQDKAHLFRLQRELGGRSQSEVVSVALIHLLETLQRDERVHLKVTQEDKPEA